MDLNLLHLVFSLTTGGTLAGHFDLLDLLRHFPGRFREVTCGRTGTCACCSEIHGCPWFTLLGQQLSTDPEAVRRHQKPPLPFVFAIPFFMPGVHQPDDQEVSLTLVGSAVNHAADFIRAFGRCFTEDQGGAVLHVTVDGVSSRGVYGERSWLRITRRGDLVGDLRILAANDITGKSVFDKENVPVTFHTPFRQLREGRLLRTLDPSAFLRGVIRRVSSMVATYGGSEPDADFRELAELSRGIQLRQNALQFTPGIPPNRGGVQGSVHLSGDLAPFLPYLLLGEYLHAGKGASWGFGRYELSVDH